MSQRMHPMDHTSHLLSYLQRKKTTSKFIYLSGGQKVNNSMFYSPCTLSVNLSLETTWTFLVQKYNLLCTNIERCGWSTLTLLYFDLQIPGSWETTQEPCREECLDNIKYTLGLILRTFWLKIFTVWKPLPWLPPHLETSKSWTHHKKIWLLKLCLILLQLQNQLWKKKQHLIQHFLCDT